MRVRTYEKRVTGMQPLRNIQKILLLMESRDVVIFLLLSMESYSCLKYFSSWQPSVNYISVISTIYNMSGRVVSDIQTRAEGESLYIRYNTDANVVNGLKNDSSYEFIGEVILKINVV